MIKNIQKVTGFLGTTGQPAPVSDKEIDKILVAYQNPDLPNQNRFLLIEQTINNNFAGKSIAIHVAKESYKKDVYRYLYTRTL